MPSAVSHVERLDHLIAGTEQRLTSLRTLRGALENPGVAEQLAILFDRNGASAEDGSDLKLSRSYSKIEGFFAARGNAPATRQEVIQATGLTPGAATQTLYVTHRVKFIRSKPQQGQRLTLFRLR
jgi:hypothetical protein